MLKIGSVIDGKYKVLNIAGRGGTSIVYLAMNEKANKQWAIKEIDKKNCHNITTDKKEIELMKRLKHPNLPTIVDVIEYHESLLIVMDYIEGRTLENLLIEQGPMEEKNVIKWFKQLCSVLWYLHTRTPSIIYRDMKPSNIMLKPDGNVVLIDFGAAREYKEHREEDTILLGTRGYAAPEQYKRDGQSDARTDIYSLGVTMFRLLTGEEPSELKPVRKVRRELSPGLEYIVAKCVRRNKEDRYQSAKDLLFALNHYWEYDEAYRKEQKKKLIKCVIPAISCVVCMLGAITFGCLETYTRQNNYEAYLLEAETVEDKDEKMETYKKAIRLDPGEERAYLELMEQGFLEDGVFSGEENENLREILNSCEENGTSYETVFKRNQDGYGAFAYEAGILYFYKFEDKNNKKYAKKYLEAAYLNESLESSKRERAKRLRIISDYYSKIGVIDEAGDVLISYHTYWNDLLEASKGNLVEEDNERTALVMYEEVISQVISRTNEFLEGGVLKEELFSQLKDIEVHLKNDFSNMDAQKTAIYEGERKDLLKHLEKARRMVDAAKVKEESLNGRDY